MTQMIRAQFRASAAMALLAATASFAQSADAPPPTASDATIAAQRAAAAALPDDGTRDAEFSTRGF
ncbi:MAG TPA: hypothetical protein VLA50_05315, partial [Erythrobacter sp.]|nr:hypothetical protein [Erythrobacter sp.]